LTERLDERLRLMRKLTLISAPANFDKTTLLSEWVHHRGGKSSTRSPVAWVSLAEGDNAPARF